MNTNHVNPLRIDFIIAKANIPTAKKGANLVLRCPFCKGDSFVHKHNAMLNLEGNFLYCFSEKRLYGAREVSERLGITFDTSALQKQKAEAPASNYMPKNPEKPRRIEDVHAYLNRDGWTLAAEYTHFNLQGSVQYKVRRYERQLPGEKREKTFIPYVPDGTVGLNRQPTLPYGLEQFILSKSIYEVWLVEGQKCADILQKHIGAYDGIAVLGYNKPSEFEREAIVRHLSGKDIVIFEDNDPEGRRNTEKLVSILKKEATSIKVVSFHDYEEGFDVADFLEMENFKALAKKIQDAEYAYTAAHLNLVSSVHIPIAPEDEYLLDPIIPCKSIILLDGREGIGKSYLALQLAVAISAKKHFLVPGVKPVSEHKVLYFSAEETERQFYYRLLRILRSFSLEDTKNFWWISTLSDRFTCPTSCLMTTHDNEVTPTEFFDYLDDCLRHIRPALVVFDNMLHFYGLEYASTTHAAAFCHLLKTLIRNYGCSFLLVRHHPGEAKQGQAPVHGGDAVLRAQARARLVFQAQENRTRQLAIDKLSHGSPGRKIFPITVELTGGPGSTCWSPVSAK